MADDPRSRLLTRLRQGGLSATDANAALDEYDETLLDLLNDLCDSDPCWYDHHGYCQAHFWLTTEPTCPHARAQALLDSGEDT